MKRRLLAGVLSVLLFCSNVSISALAYPDMDVTVETESESEQTTEAIVAEESEQTTEIAIEETITEIGLLEETSVEETVLEKTTEAVTLTEETVTETATLTEGMMAEIEAVSQNVTPFSLDKNYLVDKTPDENGNYDGDYLVIVNDSGTVSNSSANIQQAFSENTDTRVVMGYDDYGNALIDPASVLPELKVDYEAIQHNEQNTMNSVSATSYTKGTTKTFKLMTGVEKYSDVECVCISIGTHCTLWIPTSDPIYQEDLTNGTGIMSGYMDQLTAEFDSQYNRMATMFGTTDYVDETYGDNDGKTAIFCYDLEGDGETNTSGGFLAGYFFGADLNANFLNKTGNNIDCIHMDSYQAMGRNMDTNKLEYPLYFKGTLVHELQHMIFFSACREQEPYFYSIVPDTWINEAYSAAAQHLCYGETEATSRINTYNQSAMIPMGYPLAVWGSTLENYALVYMFSQYMRIQYGLLGNEGETIYKATLAELSEGKDDLFAIIADKLETTKEELLLDYRIAMQLKNADGRYGFGGETWVESVSSDRYYTGQDHYLGSYGAGIVTKNDGSYTGDIDLSKYALAGINTQVACEDISVSISGDSSISTYQGSIQLSAAVLPASVGQAVLWSITSGADCAVINVNTGVLTAVQDGTVTVRATSVLSPTKYAEKTITIENQMTVQVAKQESIFNGGRFLKYVVALPVDAEIYYTTDGTKPTTSDEAFPAAGLSFSKPGNYHIRVLGHDPSGTYGDSYYEDKFEIVQLSAPEIIAAENEGELTSYNIKISAQEGAKIYYTLDGTNPTLDSTEYTDEFVIDTVGTTTIKAIAVKAGSINSEISQKEVVVRYKVTGIALDQEEITLFSNLTAEDKSVALNAIITPETAEADVEWTSSDSDVATVDDGGVVTAVTPGTAQIEVSAEGYKDVCTVTVKAAAERIEVSNSSFAITKDKGTLALKATVLPQDAVNTNLTYVVESSNREGDVKGRASISQEGVITAIKNGVVKVTISTDEVPGKAGIAITEIIYVTISNQISYESQYRPVFTQTTFSLNKKGTTAKEFAVLPVGDTQITALEIDESSEYAQWIALARVEDTNQWSLSLTESGKSAITEGNHKVPVIVQTEEAFEVNLTVKITNTLPKVSVGKVTMNPNYPNRTYPLNVSSKSGQVMILGIADSISTAGFTQNFTYDAESGTLSATRAYGDFIKDSKNKPVLTGLVMVQVAGYDVQSVPITIKVSNVAPKLETANKTYNLNFTKLNQDKEITVAVKHVISSKEKQDLTTVSNVTLNENAGRNYTKVKDMVNVQLQDGKVNIHFVAEAVKTGTYTIPLLIDSYSETNNENNFAQAKCNVKVVVKKSTQMPKLTLSTKSVKLNKRLSGDMAVIAVKSIDQSNVNLTGFTITAAAAKRTSNVDQAVQMRYNSITGQLEAFFDGTPGCNKYVFKCTPVYEGINDNGENVIAPVLVTVTVVNKAYSVKVSAKGSIDALNRSGSSITYKIKKNNFTDVITNVSMVEIADTSKYSDTLLNAKTYFEAPVLHADGTVTIRAKEDVVLIKKCKYTFRLAFTLANCDETVVTGNMTIVPKQSSVKMSASTKPVFYDKVTNTNNMVPVTLSTNKGAIRDVIFRPEVNTKLPDAIDVIIDENGQLSAVTFDGTENVKKGTYTILLDVYYEGQLWEAPTSKAPTYEKPMVYKLKITVK